MTGLSFLDFCMHCAIRVTETNPPNLTVLTIFLFFFNYYFCFSITVFTTLLELKAQVTLVIVCVALGVVTGPASPENSLATRILESFPRATKSEPAGAGPGSPRGSGAGDPWRTL